MLEQWEEHQPPIRSNTYFGVASLKEIVLSSRFSRFFFSVCRGQGRTFYAEAVGFFFERLRHDSRPVLARQRDELVG